MTKEQQKDNRPDRIRKLLNVERFFLWHPLTMVALIARIQGDVSEQRLRAAIEKARQMHPLLTSRIIIDEHQDAWFSADTLVNSVRVVERESNTMWKDELWNEYRIPFAYESGPLIRFVLLYSPEESELITISSHVICDGMAVSLLIRDILTFYADPEAANEKVIPPVITDYLSPGEKLSVKKWMGRFFIARFNTKWHKTSHFFNQEDYEVIHQACSANLTPDFLSIEFDEDETESLLRRCRKNQVTMNSLVTVACLAAYHDIIGPLPRKNQTVFIPFDLRRHCGYSGSDPFCMFAGGLQFSYSYNPNKPFFTNVRDLHQNVEKLVQEKNSEGIFLCEQFDPSLLTAYGIFGLFHHIFPDVYVKTERLSQFAKDTTNIAHKLFRDFHKKMPGIVSTNLGRLTIPDRYSDLTLDRIWFLPAINISSPLVLGGVSIGNRTTWTISFVREEDYYPIKPGYMKRIHDRAQAYINEEG